MGKFRGAPEAAIFDVEELRDGSDLRVDDGGIECAAGSGEDFGLGDGVGKRIRGALELGALAAIRFGDGEQQAAETGAAHLIFGRKIRAAEKRAAVGQKKTGQRPAALSGDGADGRLVARVDVGAFVAIHFDGNKIVADDFGDGGIFVDSRSMTWHQWHHTAPMSSSMGLSSALARSKAAGPHSYQSMG